MKQLLYLIFGKRAEGEVLNRPTFTSTYPTARLTETEWANHVNFGSRYGHRGSFYQNR